MKSSQNKRPNIWDCELSMGYGDDSGYVADTEHGKDVFQGLRDGLPNPGRPVHVRSNTKEDAGITYTAPQYSSATPRRGNATTGRTLVVTVPICHRPNPSVPRGQPIYGTTIPELVIPPAIHGENGRGVGRNKELTVLEKFREMEKQILNISVTVEEVEFEIREENLNTRYSGYFGGGEIFPLKTLAEFENMEYMLQNDVGFGSSVVFLLRKIVGLNSKCFVEKMMAYTLSGNVASMFTVTREPGMKMAFQKTQLIFIFYRAVLSHPLHQCTHHRTFLTWILECLQKADSRMEKGPSASPAVVTID